MAEYGNKHIVAALLTQTYVTSVPGFNRQFLGTTGPVPSEGNLEMLGRVYATFLGKLDIYTGWGEKTGAN